MSLSESRTFNALSNRNYRLFFTGQTLSLIGSWMQTVGQAWLVLVLTGSGTWLGVVVAVQNLPTSAHRAIRRTGGRPGGQAQAPASLHKRSWGVPLY